jgi:hypothetical protein
MIIIGIILIYLSIIGTKRTENDKNPSLLVQGAIFSGFIAGVVFIVVGLIRLF